VNAKAEDEKARLARNFEIANGSKSLSKRCELGDVRRRTLLQRVWMKTDEDKM